MQQSILHKQISVCERCPRLVKYREGIKPAKRFAGWDYWHRPVPGFGDINAKILIVGLAPSAHGGNRTGRVFTGDPSGDFLFDAIYKAGLSNQPTSKSKDDSLVLKNVYITAIVKCAPPGNKPERIEALRCVATFLLRELEALKKVKVIVPLGNFSLTWLKYALGKLGHDTKEIKGFKHGKKYRAGPYKILVSYHVSPRNTNTGTLTEKMFVGVLKKAKSMAQ